MKQRFQKEKQISRRGILAILGSSLLIPFLGFGKTINEEILISTKDEEYQTLLKPDGTIVKVKVNTLKIYNITYFNNTFATNYFSKNTSVIF